MATVYCDRGQNIDFFISKFKRLVGEEHIIHEYKARQHFKTNSEKRHDKSVRAAARRKKHR